MTATIPLTVGAVVMLVAVHRSLSATAAQEAHTMASDVASIMAVEGVPGVLARSVDAGDDGSLVQVLDAAGTVLYSSSYRDRLAPVSNARPATGVTQLSGSREWPWSPSSQPLIAARGVEFAGNHYTVLVGVRQGLTLRATESLVTVMMWGLPLIVLLTALMAWWLVGRTLRTVEEIRVSVERITAQRLDSRVPTPTTHDEIRSLANTMNDMLRRLEVSHDVQQRFIADASHELRSPLASVRAAVHLLGGTPSSEAELLPLIDHETARMQRLVDDLLTLSKADEQGTIELHRQEVDLDDLVVAEVARLRQTTSVEVRSTITAVRVNADLHQLARALRNVADNAVRAAEATASPDQPARVAFHLFRSHGKAVVTVDDNGPGIDPTQRERVFDRFVRLDSERSRQTGGSGLGLAIVREVMAAHGGSATVEDAPIGGARLRLQLPAPG